MGLVWGTIKYIHSPRREDPEFTIRACTVTAQWPGASAERMEDLVVQPLERTIEEIDEVEKTSSTTITGFTTIKVEMEDYVTNVDQICDKIRSQLAGVALPDGVTPPYVNSNYGDTAAMVLAIYQVPGKNKKQYSMRNLEEYCEDIRDDLNHIKEIALVKIMSAPQEVIYIEPDSSSWSQIDVSVDEIKQYLSNRNKLLPGGVIDDGKNSYNVAVQGDLNVIDEIKHTVVSTNSNHLPVWLNSLGFKVIRDYISPLSIITRYSNNKINSQRCILFYFTMKKEKNIVALGNLLRKKINEWEQTILPPDIKIGIVSDQPKTVEENIGVFTNNLLQSIMILFLVAWLLIGKRVALIMGISIPIIAMTSFAIARLFNVQLESMSIASLIISLGMLVDCGIEICDNVHRLQHDGYTRFEAVKEGTRQVLFPILIGTLTTVFAFFPMINIPGNMGEFIRSIPIVVSITLIVSWIIAITFTATLTWMVLKPGTDNVPPIASLFNFIKNKTIRHKNRKSLSDKTSSENFYLYRKFLRWSLQNRSVVFTGAISLFILTIFLLKTDIIKTDFIPAAGGKQFLVDIWLPEGSSITQTSKTCKKVEEIILEQAKKVDKEFKTKCFDNMTSVIGESLPRFKLAIMPEFPKRNFAQILVNAANADTAKTFISKISNECNNKITDARITVKRLGLGPSAKYPIIVRLTGSDYFILKKYASEIESILNKIPGTSDVHDGWGNLASQINIIPDEEKSAVAGISRLSAGNTLNAFFSGALLTTFREGDHTIPVYFRLPYSERNNIRKLKELYIEGSLGKVPLSSVSKINISFEPVRIERFMQQRNMEILAQINDGFLANSIIKKALPEIKKIQSRMPSGYNIEIGGTYEKSQEGSGHIGKAMLIALALIIICLLIYFNSIIKTLAVTFTLPLACTGAFLGLYIMNQPLGFFAQLGLLSLFGIVVNSAIVLFDFIGILVSERKNDSSGLTNSKYNGLTKKQFMDCIVEAGALRIRPIMLTTFTTIGGLLPLAFGGGPLFEPLATVIIFGLLYSTVLSLVLIPIIYFSCVEKFNMKIQKTEDVSKL